MGFLEVVGRTFRPSERRVIDADVFFDMVNERKTAAGKPVTPESALTGTVAVFAAVSLLSQNVGSLPAFLFRRVNDRERERVASVRERWPGSLARLIHEAPNPEMTAQEYWQLVEGHTDLWGNHFSYIERRGDGRPSELWPLHPANMDIIQRVNDDELPVGPLRYVYTLPNGQKRGLTRAEVFHVKDFSTDGLVGISRIAAARNAIGIEQAAGEYAGRFFSNSAIPGGILKTTENFSPQRVKQLKETWHQVQGGFSGAQKVAILHSGLEWESVGMPLKDAQFLETRQYQLEEIARMFHIPLHLLGETTKETTWGTGIEQMTIGFVVYTLRAHLKRIESAINRDLADPVSGRTLLDEGLFVEFSVEGLLRGDMKTRADFYQSGITNSWLTPEDVRSRENLPPLGGVDRPMKSTNLEFINPDGTTSGGGVAEAEPSRKKRNEAREAYERHLLEMQNGLTQPPQ